MPERRAVTIVLLGGGAGLGVMFERRFEEFADVLIYLLEGV